MKKVIVAASILAFAASGAAFADKGGVPNGGNSSKGAKMTTAAGQSDSAKTQVIVKDVAKIANLELKPVTITPEDISSANNDNKDFTAKIGTFCSYTNHKDGKMNLKIDSAQKEFQLHGTGNISDIKVPYTLVVNKTEFSAPSTKKHQTGGDNDINCSNPETVTLVVNHKSVVAAKAGTYDIGLTFESTPAA